MLPECITVEIKQEHIDQGQRGMSCDCAVALALGETYKTVEVDWHDIWINNHCYKPSEELTQFIQLFDGGVAVKPAVHNLTIAR